LLPNKSGKIASLAVASESLICIGVASCVAAICVIDRSAMRTPPKPEGSSSPISTVRVTPPASFALNADATKLRARSYGKVQYADMMKTTPKNSV
jgi:hypothetical protein